MINNDDIHTCTHITNIILSSLANEGYHYLLSVGATDSCMHGGLQKTTVILI